MKGKHNPDVKSGCKNKLRFRKINDIIRMVKEHKYIKIQIFVEVLTA